MAIAFVSSGLVNTTTASYTVGSGSDRLLVLYLVGGINTDTISAVTYAGVSMTLIGKINAGANRFVYLWYLLNPASGSNAFSITDGGNLNNGACSDFTGVLQSGQPDASGTNTGLVVTSISKTLTTVADNCWLVGGCFISSGITLTAGADTTVRQQNGQNAALFDSNAAKTPAGNHSLTMSMDPAATDAAIVAASFAPSGGAPPGGGRISTLGLMGAG